MKFKLLLFLTVVSFLSVSCFTKRITKGIVHDFTNCYDGRKTNIRTLLDIDGYYEMLEANGSTYGYGSKAIYVDSSVYNMLFYEDGTMVYNFFEPYGYNGTIPTYLRQVYLNGDNDIFYSTFYWGFYRIQGDTIIAQYINHTTGIAPWDAREEWFKIVDRRTLKSVYAKMVGEVMTKDQIQIWEQAMLKYSPAKFHPLDTIPPPNCWLKNEKWIWCDESKYNEWINNYNKK